MAQLDKTARAARTEQRARWSVIAVRSAIPAGAAAYLVFQIFQFVQHALAHLAAGSGF